MTAMAEGTARARAFAGWITRHARLVLGLTALLVVACAFCIARLRLNTDFAELLPASDPAVVVLHEMDRRMPALSSLDVVVQGPDAAANRRYVDALLPRLRALGDPLIDAVNSGVHEEIAFFQANQHLYVPRERLVEARDRLRLEIGRRKNPLLVDLDDAGAGPAGDDPLVAAERALREPPPPLARFPGGYFAYPDGTLYAVVIWLRSSFLHAGDGMATAERIREAALALHKEMAAPGQTVGLTGNLITAKEERAALATDLGWASGLSVALVCLVVFLFFGRLAAVPYMVIAALIGVMVALAFAQLAFGFLNTATGFMGAIIVGNGINYAIIQMARYEEERRAGRQVEEAIAVTLATTWRATGMAAIGAAIAYGSLALTDFRGFSQFGYIGGLGMIVSWLATLLVLPALWVVWDRRVMLPGGGAPLRGIGAAARLSRLILGHPRALVLAGGLLSLLAVLPLPRYLADPFEYDFDKLRNQVSKNSDSEVLSGRLNPIFGRSLSPNFVWVADPAQAPAVKRKLLAADPGRKVLGSVQIVDDFLPGDAAEQRGRLALLAELRGLIDRNLELVQGEERARLQRLRPRDGLRVLAPADLPRALLRYYTENDGTIGRIVAYFASEGINVWDGRVQLQLARLVQEITLDDGTRVRSSGGAVIFAAMLKAIMRDGPRVTLASFLGVLVLVVLLAPRRGAALIIGVLLAGVLWMMGGVAAAGVRLNFLNFVALPITFGIGVDYGANLYLRYRQEGLTGLEHALSAAGGAVALCSLTTIIGYGSLLVADTQGLVTFGAAAILGELACIVAALGLLPTTIVLLSRRAGPPSP